MDAVSGASIGLRMLAKLFPWLVGKFYTKERLSQLLDVQPLGTGDCITLQPFTHDVNCWLTFTNLSPLLLTIDRIEIRIVMDGLSATLCNILPEEVLPSARKAVFSRGILVVSGQGVELARKASRIRVEVRAYVKSPARDFIYASHLEDVRNFRLLN